MISHLAAPGTTMHTSCAAAADADDAARAAFDEAMRPLTASVADVERPQRPHYDAPAAVPETAGLGAGTMAAATAGGAEGDEGTTATASADAAAATGLGGGEPSRHFMSQSAFRKSGLARKGVQVVVQHSPQVDRLLPEPMRGVTLLFVVPRANSVRSLGRSVQARLRGASSTPRLTAQPAGDVLPDTMSVGEAHRRYAAGGARMQVSVSFAAAGTTLT